MTTGELSDPFLTALATFDLTHHPQSLSSFFVALWAPVVRGQIADPVRCGLDDAPNIVCFEQLDQIGGVRLLWQQPGEARSIHEAAVVEYLTKAVVEYPTKSEANTHAVRRTL